MDLVCDANVWYDIVRGSRCLKRLKSGGHRLLASPVSYLEILAAIDDQNFSQRQAVCRAILNHADEVLLDPDRHLATLWGLSVAAEAIDWKEVFGAVVDAKDLAELRDGVISSDGSSVRKTNVARAEQWKTERSNGFVAEIERAIDRFLPGYAAERAAKRAHFMNRALAELFANAVRQPYLQLLLAASTRYRACVRAGIAPENTPEDDVRQVCPKLVPYIAVYCEYLIDAASRCAPHPNDLADLELFMYLQDNRRLVTGENRWIGMAKAAGQSNWLMDPEKVGI